MLTSFSEESDDYGLRCLLINSMSKLVELGLNQGTSGNISVRVDNGFLITPSGIVIEDLKPEGIVKVSFEGKWEHNLTPSSEWRFHCDILKSRLDIGAVVHTHSVYCTAFSICRQTIPAAHYMIAAAGGSTIRCANYATFGTEELSREVLLALEERNACLLANHGMIAVGKDLARAIWLAVEVETLARQYATARTVGVPFILDNDEIDRVKEKFKSYGPSKK